MSNRSDLIAVGEMAPDFTAQVSDGSQVRLADHRGKQRVVLVFYPGDNTPVCTAQLCAFRNSWKELEGADAAVYGVNPASVARHADFAARQQFPFPLIADTGGKIAADYGCRALFGLIRRTVYVIDLQGRIALAQRGNPAPAQILRVLGALQDQK